jgi:ATP-dependent DNA helicase RecG
MTTKVKIAKTTSKTPITDRAEAVRNSKDILELSDPISMIRGVGPKTEKALNARSIRSIEDLIFIIPSRYEDRRYLTKMCDVTEGEEYVFVGRVVESGNTYSRISRKRMYYARVADDTGNILLKWFRFNRRALASMCSKNNLLFLSGKVTRFGADLQIIHPHVTVLGDNDNPEDVAAVIPIYPDIEGVTQGALRNILREAFSALRPGSLVSLIPHHIEVDFNLPTFIDSVRQCHFPDGCAGELPEDTNGSLSRVIVEEFFLFQAGLRLARVHTGTHGICMTRGRIYSMVRDILPFMLTAGQDLALTEIERDLGSGEPMNRLLQGDVGSGKTVCAILAAAISIDNGYQVAILAPTEILAEQHYSSIHTILSKAAIPHVLLTGSTKGADRQCALDGIEKGEFFVVIGTHALLQEKVVFHHLGLAVIDEQHRFGVIQRSSLKSKGENPHVLVMTATPIPRSLSLVAYGDLDVSLIKDMPPGRQKCVTKVVTEKDRAMIQHIILDEIAKGRQVFAIYPLIDDSDQDEIKSATTGAAQYHSLFPACRVGLLHGKMTVGEKQVAMTSFRDGIFDILVSTTVVEVGVDVINASLMVIEHAERFGLAQIHQLRGRVGRGSHPSKCILVSSSERTSAATRRLRILEKTTDGFIIAEEDLKLRGPGEMLGVRQAGMPQFRVGNMVTHMNLMILARKIAEKITEHATEEERARISHAAQDRWGERLLLGDVL